MARSISEKMGVHDGIRVYILKAPCEILEKILSDGVIVSRALKGKFDLIIAFFTSYREMQDTFLTLRSHLKHGGRLWICWPKGRGLRSDLTLQCVIAFGYSCDMVESNSICVDDVWSALKFTFPRLGKVSENSYGALPGKRIPP